MRSLWNLAIVFATLACFPLKAAESGQAVSKTLPDARPAEASELRPSLGIMGGLADTQEGLRSAASYGLEYGWQPYVPFGAAIELSGYVSEHFRDEPTLTRTRLLGKMNYNFGGDVPVIKDSYIGIGLGPVWDNVANGISVELGVAPQIGFDIPITGSRLSLGANASYMFVGGSRPEVFALNGVAKYWF